MSGEPLHFCETDDGEWRPCPVNLCEAERLVAMVTEPTSWREDRWRDKAERLREQLDAARREAESQMQSKLDAQVTLKAVTEALDLRFDELGDGWREAAPKILARIETIVDEAARAFSERDAARAALAVDKS